MASVWWWRVVERLDDSRRVAGELAVTQERLRFAADLHDIQGHHLQVIALKAELAERLQGHDAAASAAQLAEIRGIAKEALEETRALVAGLREVALEDELENAREVLTLAGAACSLEIDDLELRAHPRVQRVLALCVREGTTNILRHSAATSAAITLRRGETSFDLVLSNNGASQNGPAAADGARGAGQPLGTLGSGLASLKRRIEEIGGTLVIAHDADQFTLRVCVPHTEMSGA
nr:histidine kinase [Leucobacter exalbidus]